MLADLKDIKREMLGGKDGQPEDPALLGMDQYQRKVLEITKLLQEIRQVSYLTTVGLIPLIPIYDVMWLCVVEQEVERLRELRAAAPDGRDLNTIRMTNDNFKNLKKAQEWWKEAQQLVIVEAAKTAKKKAGCVDEKEIDNRKRKLNLLFEEIKELSQKNSSVQVEKTAVEKEIDQKKTEREKRRKERRARRKKKEGDGTETGGENGGGGGGGTADDKDDDKDDIEMRPVVQATEQEQTFMVEAQKNKEEQVRGRSLSTIDAMWYDVSRVEMIG